MSKGRAADIFLHNTAAWDCLPTPNVDGWGIPSKVCHRCWYGMSLVFARQFRAFWADAVENPEEFL